MAISDAEMERIAFHLAGMIDAVEEAASHPEEDAHHKRFAGQALKAFLDAVVIAEEIQIADLIDATVTRLRDPEARPLMSVDRPN